MFGGTGTVAIGLTDGMTQQAIYINGADMEDVKKVLFAHYGDAAFEQDVTAFADAQVAMA